MCAVLSKVDDFATFKKVEVPAKILLFTALHGMQTRSYDENSVRPTVCLSVCLSVRPSVKCVNCDKTAERYV